MVKQDYKRVRTLGKVIRSFNETNLGWRLKHYRESTLSGVDVLVYRRPMKMKEWFDLGEIIICGTQGFAECIQEYKRWYDYLLHCDTPYNPRCFEYVHDGVTYYIVTDSTKCSLDDIERSNMLGYE